jgi:nicotinate-nucleotide pyrophosphorylase (carboxylating)
MKGKAPVSSLLRQYLAEDAGSGDVTTAITPKKQVRARIISKSKGIASGIDELSLLFRLSRIKATAHIKEGGKINPGKLIFTLRGSSASILPVERTALNILGRMSGVATLTCEYAQKLRVKGSKTRVAATRKTTPGFRYFEKKAVVTGGGLPHRMGLYDMVLLKENHLRQFNGDIRRAVMSARKKQPNMAVEVEVSSEQECLESARAGADIIMFDNMSAQDIRASVKALKGEGLRDTLSLEASGGISLSNIGSYASIGLDWVSVGELTHSYPSLDFTLLFD